MTTLESFPVDGGRDLEDLTTRELARVMVKIQRLRRAKVRDLENLTVELARAKQDAATDHARAFLAHDGAAGGHPKDKRRYQRGARQNPDRTPLVFPPRLLASVPHDLTI